MGTLAARRSVTFLLFVDSNSTIEIRQGASAIGEARRVLPGVSRVSRVVLAVLSRLIATLRGGLAVQLRLPCRRSFRGTRRLSNESRHGRG